MSPVAAELRCLRLMREESKSKTSVNCPRPGCKSDSGPRSLSPERQPRVRSRGSFRRKGRSARIARFQCLRCHRSFSKATLEPERWQKKREVNEVLRKLLCSGVSQRRIARLLGISRRTVSRKFLFLANLAERELEQSLQGACPMSVNKGRGNEDKPVTEIHFDEMESFEHTKCKPVSIPLAVCSKTRRILALDVASMPASGPLAQISRRKYGPRKDERSQAGSRIFKSLAPVLPPEIVIRTDQNPRYPAWIRASFPKARHEAFKGRRGCIVGQGELKKIGFDPLFSLNHTAAMIRANVNRLFRRTWCTSKRADRLRSHLFLYAQFHNRELLSSV